jgi:hypothetical protein
MHAQPRLPGGADEADSGLLKRTRQVIPTTNAPQFKPAATPGEKHRDR